jgi:hypothetical protein
MSPLFKDVVRTTREAKPPRKWVGVVTLLAVVVIAAGIATAVQYAMVIRYEEFLRPLNYIFHYAGYLGVWAGSSVELTHNDPLDLHQTGRLVSIAVNALVYSIVIFCWLAWPADKRIK